jgi:hypothetical protein
VSEGQKIKEVVKFYVLAGSLESYSKLCMGQAEREFIFPQRKSKDQERNIHNDFIWVQLQGRERPRYGAMIV